MDTNKLAERLHAAMPFADMVPTCVVRDLLAVIAKQHEALAMFQHYKFGDGDITHAIRCALTLSAPLVKLIETENV